MINTTSNVQRRASGLATLASTLVMGVSIPTTHAAILEEIIVTAQKREQSMQDVGISVSAFDGDQLKALGVTNTVEITQQVPGFNMNSFSPAITIFNLRGISQNNFSDNLEAPVATYVDDAYIVSMNAINGQLFDTERAEVLRGPQGTLFGRNATGGLVQFISKRPTQEREGYVEVSAADYDKFSVEGAISGKISENVLGRLSARWETSEGYLENQYPGGRDSSGLDGYALKGQLQLDITDSLDAWIKVSYAEDDDVPTGAYKFAPSTPNPVTGLGNIESQTNVHEINSDTDGYMDRENSSATIKLTWDLGDLELVSITNYMANDKVYLEDADARPAPIFLFGADSDHKQWSQEFRLSGEGERSRWQTGLYYLSFEQENAATVRGFIASGGGGQNGGFDMQNSLDATNWSVFGQYEYDLGETLTLVTGYRWSQDDKDFSYAGQRILDFGAGFESVLEADYEDKIDYGDWAARVQLDWRPAENVLAFAAWNKGIKGGNWVTPSFFVDVLDFSTGEIPDGALKHHEETLYSYEVGTKFSFLDGAARLNATLFYYDYQDYQSFSTTNFIQTVVNRDAEAVGGELELTLLPAEGWDVLLGLSVVDSHVENVPAVTEGVEVDAELPMAPKVSINGLVRYEWAALGGTMSAQFDFNYNGDQYLETTNAPASFEDAHFIGNANVAYTAADAQWKVMAWVKNVTNTEYRVYNLDLAGADVVGGTPFNESVFGPPRWYGFTASYHF